MVELLTLPAASKTTVPEKPLPEPPGTELIVTEVPFLLLHDALAVNPEMQDCPVIVSVAVALPPAVGGGEGEKFAVNPVVPSW
jgi:hypothetical protein